MAQQVRLASIWFLYLGGVALFLPFYAMYLNENAGLSGAQVGRVWGAVTLLGIAAQPFWGNVADRSGSRTRVLAILTFGAAVGYAALYWPRSFLGLLLGTAFFAAFHTAVIPMTFSVTFALLRTAGRHSFGLVRVWGTIGFLIVVVVFPRVLDRIQAARGWVAEAGGPSEPGLEIAFPVAAAFFLVASLVAASLPRTGAVGLRAPRGDWKRLMRHKPYVRLVAFLFVAYILLHGPMLMYPVLVRAQGGSMGSVSEMWILMLALEIPLIAFSGTTLARFGPRGLMVIGLLAGGLRWALCGFVPTLPVLYAASILHGVVVAGLIVGAPLYVDAVVPERLRSTGQSLQAMLGVGLGGTLSALASGWLHDQYGAAAAYKVGGVGAILLALLMPLLLPAPSRPAAVDGEELDDLVV